MQHMQCVQISMDGPLTTEMDMDREKNNIDSQESQVDDYYLCDARRHLHDVVFQGQLLNKLKHR